MKERSVDTESSPHSTLSFVSSLLPPRLFTNVHQASLYLRYLFLKNFRSPFYTVYAVFCALLSLLILWSELTMGIPVNLSPLASLLNLPGFLLETFVMLPLLYMSVAVYGSLFKVRIFGKYGLRSKKRSDGPALAFSASYLVRMQVRRMSNAVTGDQKTFTRPSVR